MTEIIDDVDGLRIGDFAIDYFPPKLSMWDGEKWIEQDLDPPRHIPYLQNALDFLKEWYPDE